MSVALTMFRKTTKDGDIKKAAQKVADPKKDTLTRLKHLRTVLDNYETADAKKFFDENYSHIYYIFYDNFVNVEADLKQRVNKSHREELDHILQIFEKILLLLPELIHKRWMFHSIGRIMKKLLHPGNGIKLRREGLRLFLIWYQILFVNASEECHQIFLELVPGLGNGIQQESLNEKILATQDSFGSFITAGEVTPILTSPGEKQPDNITKFFFDALLQFMVSEVTKVEWLNKEMRETCFTFLFNKFKESYLIWLFPDFDKSRSIYNPSLDLPKPRSAKDVSKLDVPDNVSECRDSFIRWVTVFTVSSKRQEMSGSKTSADSMVAEGEEEPREDKDVSDSKEEIVVDQGPGSNTSTLSTGSQCTEKDSANSSFCSDEHSQSESDIVRTVLYSSRENVNIVHEVFRQAMLFCFNHAGSIRRVIAVYKDWFQESSPSSLPLQLSRDSGELKHWLRNASYLGAVQDLADGGDISQFDMRAGLQRMLQVFITNAANIFLLTVDDDLMMQEQVDICKRVLNIYRYMVMKIPMEQKTWEQMLLVLLCITSGVLSDQTLLFKAKSLGGRLAQAIFQTLIVTWIKANLNVFISSNLWNQFLQVLSSLTSWEELIKEWAKTMETLTRVLAKNVYNLDLNDLPLDRLSEQKEKRKRGRSQEIPKNKVSDQSFSRAWSKSESGTEKTVVGSTNSPQVVNFDRRKYKSDGAGGNKSRPDIIKQRSLSREPSPTLSRSSSLSSDSALLVRSSSDGNIPGSDMNRLTEDSSTNIRPGDVEETLVLSLNSRLSPLNQFSSSSGENVEISLSSTISSVDGLSLQHEFSTDHSIESSIGSERSNADTLVRRSRSPSPTLVQYQSRSRTPSPTPSSELAADHHSQHKDSPTPDRDSLHIDMVANHTDTPVNKGSLEELKSVMAGGFVPGWLPDVAVVLWCRMLGSLGDVNKIENPDIHASVFEHLCDIHDTLIRIRENLGVTQDNQSSPSPPEFIPPHSLFAAWLFECLSLSNKYKRGKLLAYQLLCQMMIRPHDVMPSTELLSQFYLVLHQGLLSPEQDVKNVIVKYCGGKYFFMPLPGNTLLIKDFILACEAVVQSVDIRQTPRSEAISLIGSLVCFPNHCKDIPCLDESFERVNLDPISLRDHTLRLLIRAGKKEPAGLARCIAISSLGIFLYEELSHGKLHSKLAEAVNVLLGALRCMNKMVARVASDMLTLLCDHADKLLEYHPGLPKRIIDVTSSTISAFMPMNEGSVSEEEEKLLTSMMFCVVEWCMKMPMPLLLESSHTDKLYLFKVFQMLNVAVSGHTSESLSQATQTLVDLWQDKEFEGVREVGSISRLSSSDSLTSNLSEKIKTPSINGNKGKVDTELIKVAARLLMNHLVNYLSHFPNGIGASQLCSSVQEHCDIPDYYVDDLKTEIFSAPNVQFFVLNQRTLISYIELPAMLNVPGGGVTAGLTTATTVCRVVLRDLTGKYCWESAVLYGPPWCPKGSYFEKARKLHRLSADGDLEPLIIQEDSDLPQPIAPQNPRSYQEIPFFEPSKEQEGSDNLFDLLGYVGQTSPECLLIPGVPLNIEAPVPEDLNETVESQMQNMVLLQKEAELEYYKKHKADASMLAKPQMPTEIKEPVSPFQICRMLLDQLGLLSWEKRCHFDLLKKTDKLLRELKNLDMQKCRETHKFAVIFVAEGQEDKNSILSNEGGSAAFEEFVAGLGWEVDLECHKGFLGGLQQNRSTGDTAPYYAKSTYEILYHVSTRIPSGNEESRHIKMRHLGNDEVHIVWSEHTRDYRRGIIPTDFGDVIIIIYPLNNGLFRIQINRKPEVEFFGPLFDGAIVDQKVLPGLVRATAINASRMIRSLNKYYHSYYEERARCLDAVIQQHVESTMFEEFSAQVFAPVLPPNSAILESPSDSNLSTQSSTSLVEINKQVDQSQPSVSPPTTRQSRVFTDLFKIG
ncbi:hypothetical protein ACJMK2_035835 [Sinanodonta woodiana]|uniref:Rap-GAP domain-containing protein n=1 Tax=Sinanodonta woodiana TaxID=1069815 RepID=A0ABD3WJE2_SINWO